MYYVSGSLWLKERIHLWLQKLFKFSRLPTQAFNYTTILWFRNLCSIAINCYFFNSVNIYFIACMILLINRFSIFLLVVCVCAGSELLVFSRSSIAFRMSISDHHIAHFLSCLQLYLQFTFALSGLVLEETASMRLPFCLFCFHLVQVPKFFNIADWKQENCNRAFFPLIFCFGLLFSIRCLVHLFIVMPTQICFGNILRSPVLWVMRFWWFSFPFTSKYFRIS